MPNQSAQLNRVFQALADPTRRAVLERLNRGPTSMSDLAQPFDMALPSFSQHLDVLEGCCLVSSQKRGRIRTYRLVSKRLRQAEDWLHAQRVQWERRFDQLDEYLLSEKEQQP